MYVRILIIIFYHVTIMMNLHGMEDENALVEQREMIFLFQDSRISRHLIQHVIKQRETSYNTRNVAIIRKTRAVS